MKTTAIFLSLFLFFNNGSKTERVESKVYSFSKANIEKTSSGEKRQLIDGETTHLENFEIHTTMLEPGNAPHGSHVHVDSEEIVFVKEGKLKVTVNNQPKIIGAGSVALLMPGDEHGLENAGEGRATYYIIRYKSKNLQNNERGKLAGGSAVFDWDALEFRTHDRGGVRKFFDRKSSMSERIEMHATTLNPGIKSHEPHTHNPEEIIVMMKGTTEMEIGDGKFPGEPGDIFFLGANVPHGIRNTGTEPCMYLAFQFE